MAVDTKAKRFSMLNMPVVGSSRLMIDPAATAVDAGDMYHFLGLYEGISLEEADDINDQLIRIKSILEYIASQI